MQNEVVLGPRDNGFPGPTVALDGPVDYSTTLTPFAPMFWTRNTSKHHHRRRRRRRRRRRHNLYYWN